jgi:glycosyltransferase involved in cell wall biosynthesis
MKILLVTPEFPPDFGGGIITYYQNLAPALRAHGCSVEILKGSAFTHGGKDYVHEGISVSVLETARFAKWLGCFDHFAMFPELRRHLAAGFALHELAKKGDGFDVVEVTDWGLLFLPWMIEADARVLVQLHGSTGQIAYYEPGTGRESEGAFSLLLEKSALGEAPALSTYSHANVRWWEALLRRPIHYLPPPLKLKSFRPGEKISSDTWLSVGRIQHWKGPQVVCAAWEQLGVKAPQLQWAGRDTVHGKTGQSASAWLGREFPAAWGKKIQPIGQFPSDEVQQRMGVAKAVLIPSLWDTFNLAAAEAMALGKVVVVSDGAGAADLVKHGVNGFVFPKGDAVALAKLVRLVENLDPVELHKIGNKAALTVHEQLAPDHIAVEKIKLYRSLPEPTSNRVTWLNECLLPATGAKPFAFLDGLPLKELTRYVARRGFGKFFQAGKS